jgi:peptide/nickel transport system permease protein
VSVESAFGLALAALLAGLAVWFARRRARRYLPGPAPMLGLGVLVFFIALAVLAPLVAPYRPSLQLDIVGLQNHPPSWRFPLGTDLYSRDVWSRLVFGARVSLGVGALATVVALGLGTLVGATAGYFRRADGPLMRLVDVGLAVPRIFLVLVAIAVGYRLGTVALALLLGGTGWFGTSRLVRAEFLGLRERAFVDAARALGVGPWRIIARHLLPNAGATLLVSAALGVANMMLLESALSFLGVGVQPPVPSWGNMIADARDYLATAPWASAFPGLAITIVVMALHAVADGMRAALRPGVKSEQ